MSWRKNRQLQQQQVANKYILYIYIVVNEGAHSRWSLQNSLSALALFWMCCVWCLQQHDLQYMCSLCLFWPFALSTSVYWTTFTFSLPHQLQSVWQLGFQSLHVYFFPALQPCAEAPCLTLSIERLPVRLCVFPVVSLFPVSMLLCGLTLILFGPSY